MGNRVRGPVVPDDDDGERPAEFSDEQVPLGDFLSGRFADSDVDPVEAVRRIRRRDRG